MKTSILAALLFSVILLPAHLGAEPEKAKAEDGAIEAKVVAVNRGFGFVVVNVGSKQGVKKAMEVLVLRGKKRDCSGSMRSRKTKRS